MNRLSKHHFWEWFKRHNQEYATLQSKSKKDMAYWLNELKAHLRAYYKFFEFSISWKNKHPSTLTITVHGKAMHFKKVDALVAVAPDIPGWNIRALEGPMPVDFIPYKHLAEAGIDPKELYFSIDNEAPERAFITVYHPLCTEENEHLLSQLALTVVYNLLGERSYGLDIADIEVANLSVADPNEVQKLEELPAAIDSRSSSITVDDKGRLLGM
jgi:hypothetical protein